MDKKVRDLLRETESKLNPNQYYEEEEYDEEESSLDMPSIAIAGVGIVLFVVIAVTAFLFLQERLLLNVSQGMRLPIIIGVIVFLFIYDGSPLRRIFRGITGGFSTRIFRTSRRRRPPRKKEIYY